MTAVSKKFNSIHVTWDQVLKKQRHGIIIKYEVMVLQGAWNKTDNYSKNYTDADIQDLQMMETYQVQVRAYTRIGPGPYSHPAKNVTTIEEGICKLIILVQVVVEAVVVAPWSPHVLVVTVEVCSSYTG